MTAKTKPTTAAAPVAPAPLAYRPKRLAPLLGISLSTLAQLTRDGKIPHVRIGTALLYPEEQVRQWLADQAKAKKSA